MKQLAIRILQITLRFLVRMILARYKPTIVAITGSAGKTSTKEAIFSVLSRFKRVRKSAKNFNTELGVSLAIIGEWERISSPVIFFWFSVIGSAIKQIIFSSPSYPEILVLEYGADRAGDIDKLMDIAHPDISVISAIGTIPVHVEFYAAGVEGVVREKSKLAVKLPAGKCVFLNADDPHTVEIEKRTRARVETFGFSEKATMRVFQFNHIYDKATIRGALCKIQKEGSIVPVTLPAVFSVSHGYAITAALLVAQEFGINMVSAGEALSDAYEAAEGRSRIIPGIKHTQIIDETYNSSPLALETALQTLSLITSKRKIAVLGDMLELGDYSLKAHERAGKQVVGAVDILVTVGPRSRFIAAQAKKNGMKESNVYVFETADEARKTVQDIMKEGDILLIKGSRAIGLDTILREVVER